MKTINLYHITEADLRLIVGCLMYVNETFKKVPDEVPDYLSLLSLTSILRNSKYSIPRLIARLEKRL